MTTKRISLQYRLVAAKSVSREQLPFLLSSLQSRWDRVTSHNQGNMSLLAEVFAYLVCLLTVSFHPGEWVACRVQPRREAAWVPNGMWKLPNQEPLA
jgi:hypothetical protein